MPGQRTEKDVGECWIYRKKDIKKLTSVREISFRGSEGQGAWRRKSEASVLPYEG
jgi:hypothetical protein